MKWLKRIFTSKNTPDSNTRRMETNASSPSPQPVNQIVSSVLESLEAARSAEKLKSGDSKNVVTSDTPAMSQKPDVSTIAQNLVTLIESRLIEEKLSADATYRQLIDGSDFETSPFVKEIKLIGHKVAADGGKSLMQEIISCVENHYGRRHAISLSMYWDGIGGWIS